MKEFFYAESVAIFGVSDKEGNLTKNILSSLNNWGYRGRVYPIGRSGGEVRGRRVYPSLDDVDGVVGLAVVMTPARVIPDIMDACAARGIKRLALISGGFAEYSGAGSGLDGLIREKARLHGMRFVGPNCVAVANSDNGLALPFLNIAKRRKGGISFITQSGGMAMFFFGLIDSENLGFSKMVSVGNKADTDEVDFLEYFGGDKKTKVICVHVESLERGREFVDAARRIKKPIILYKSNVSPAAASTAMSHTAALANDHEVLAAAMREAGVIVVDDFVELIERAKMFSQPSPKSNRTAVVSHSGGACVMAADECAKRGFETPPLGEKTLKEVEAMGKVGIFRLTNPLDLGDLFEPERIMKAAELAVADGNVDSMIFSLVRREEPTEGYGIHQWRVSPTLKKFSRKYGKPILFVLLANSKITAQERRTRDFPVYNSMSEAVECFAALRDFGLRKKERGGKPAKVKLKEEKIKSILAAARGGRVDDVGAFELLEACGVAAPKTFRARDGAEAVKHFKKLGAKVALKISSPDIFHKSDVGGVRAGLETAEEVVRAFSEMMDEVKEKAPGAKVGGALVQEMVEGVAEVIVGVRKDPHFGHYAVFGIGGVFVEVVRDFGIAMAPVAGNRAVELVRGVRGYPLLEGVRGGAAGDVRAVADCIVKLSALVSRFPEIAEIEINPLVVLEDGKGARAVDVKVKVEAGRNRKP